MAMDSKKVSDWSEIISSIVVVLSLVFLIVEVRTQTQAIERQAAYERSRSYSEPFTDPTILAEAHAKIRAVDGESPTVDALQDRYGLTEREAEVWSRHLLQTWLSLQADFAFGDRDVALGTARAMLAFPDQRLWLQGFIAGGGVDGAFQAELERMMAETPVQ